MTLFFTAFSCLILYIAYKIVDIYFPKKTLKEAVLLRKHTESYTSASMDSSGGGHETQHTRYLFTVEYPRSTQTETVPQRVYSHAVVGQKLKVVRCSGRFSKKLIKFSFVL